jgi:hypothetical protein
MMVKQWWNGELDRFARRDVVVWATEGRERWMVEARWGGADGTSRFRETPTEHEAFALAMRWRNASRGDEWKDISRLVANPPERSAEEMP